VTEVIDLDRPLVDELLQRCSFPGSAATVTCAVSGGPDSLALLVLARAAGCVVTAVHVDHGLRAGSDAEALVVADAARRCGASFRSERVSVAPGPNLEARARDARRSVLPAEALTGHTADDRAETVLLNLLRGAGVTGAAGIARSPKRPLLDLRRTQTHALCAALGLQPVHDPSNDSPLHRRNRVRHELVPLLDDIADRDVTPVLVRQADLFAEVANHVASEAELVDVSSAGVLAAAPVAVARQAVRAWLLHAGVGAGHPVDAAAVDRILAVAGGERTATELAGGWRVARTAGRLRVEATGAWQDASRA
jgi:tRNA(Ile)-lysidine synthase